MGDEYSRRDSRMIRLGISAEGATEREFVNTVLRQHLQQFNILAIGIDLRGNISLDKIKSELPRLLGSFDFVSTFYDFYGFKSRQGRDIDKLVLDMLALVKEDQRNRFIPYVQSYEFEALLFSVPEQTVEWMCGSEQELKQMKEAVKKAGSPELVNDSPQTSPSHRIMALFPNYDKKLHGPEIIDLAGLNLIRECCPRFDEWLTQLERLEK